MNGSQPRGCGSGRESGGIYMETGEAGEFGIPMEMFIQDPLITIDPDHYGISSIGVKLIEMNGVTHVFDWVGAKHYPNAADFLEEAVRLGLSRRISRSEDFSRLTPESKLILIHPKGYVLTDIEEGTQVPCPLGTHDTNAKGFDKRTEAGILWLMGDCKTLSGGAVPGRSPEWSKLSVNTETFGRREMPAFTYALREMPPGAKFAPGIIMVAPISRLCVVKDPLDQENFYASFDAAAQANLPVITGDE